MHTLLLLLTIVSLIMSWLFASRCLQHIDMTAWKWRRRIQLLVLTMPVLLLSTCIGGAQYFISLCPSVMATWDVWSGMLLPLALSVIALGALGWGSVRLVFMAWWLKKQPVLTDATLQATVDILVQRYAFPPVRAWLIQSSLPLAFTTGIRRPQIGLSTWMTQHLDQAEVEAVLTHELEHVVRRDYLFTWITTVLRDAFFYLPTSRHMYRQIHCEKELQCDQQVVQRTHRPLALASALTKVWLHAVNPVEMSRFHMAQSLTGRHAEIQTRVERLLSQPAGMKVEAGQGERKGQKEAALLGASFCLQGIMILVVMVLMGCLPLFL